MSIASHSQCTHNTLSCTRIFKKTSQDKTVVIKKVHMSQECYTLKNFLNEAAILSLIIHPNIVSFHRSYPDQSSHYCIEMEYLSGGNLLETRINGDFEKIYKWIFQISRALAYLHSLGIIHRDVKLSNLMRNSDDDVKLIDFGLSTFKWCLPFDRKWPVGSPCYMAPQIITNQEYDEKVDIYALGSCIYQLVYNKTPYRGSTPSEYWQDTLRGTIDFQPTCPAELIDLMREMLHKSQRQRPSVAQVLAHPSLRQRFP